MSIAEPPAAGPRSRREPPPFRRVAVCDHEPITPRLVRVTLTGPELAGFALDLPAASVRLLLPTPGHELEIPRWNGNEFLLADGSRPVLRTMTPVRFDLEALELDIEMVIHGHGPASTWAASVERGLLGAISGPGRGYAIDDGAPGFLLAGDESALPAITQLLPRLPPAVPVQVLVEIGDPSARRALPERGALSVRWLDLDPGAAPGTALVPAVEHLALAPRTCVWAAGEAAAMQRVRRHLFEERGVPRADATIRGYWKVGRGGDAG
jgi:NADPH-dependent ferric siderophore reductase